MNPIKILSKPIMLMAAFAFFCAKLSAQDHITLTWYAEGEKSFYLIVSNYLVSPYTINWGDGYIETLYYNGYVGNSHFYNVSGEYTVTIKTPHSDCKITNLDCSGYYEDGQFISNRVNNIEIISCDHLNRLLCQSNDLTSLDVSKIKYLVELNCGNNQLTNLDLANCFYLEELWCYENQLSNLDLKDCRELRRISVSDNRLSFLDFSNCPRIREIYCHINRFQLSNLYAFHLLADYKILGTQTLPSKWVNIETELFEAQSQFGGIFTEYQVEKEGAPAPESDYTVTEGKLMFLNTGIYTVQMTNKALSSYPDYPTEVNITLEVVPLSVPENEPAKVAVYPNPTTGELRVKSEELRVESVELFDIYGRKLVSYPISQISNFTSIDISHFPTGIYLLKMDTEQGIIVKKLVKQ